MYIDTHCHITSNDYDNIDLLIQNNLNSDVNKIIVSSCAYNTMKESILLSKKYESIYLTLGFHPDQALCVTDQQLIELKKMLKLNKVVGVGEIGLDYHYGKENRLKQIDLFKKQLKIASELNLPVVIHSRDATLDTIEILSQYNVKGVIHCYSGSYETALKYISMGFLLGIGGVVTFKNSNLGEVVKKIGLNNIVLETDSPYLTPEPYRGTKNSSKYIPIIANKISMLLNIDQKIVEKVTTNNAISMFDLN